MPTDKQLLLLLGCFGRITSGFISCSTTENIILTVEDHLVHYDSMMDYFEQCRLFDKPIFDTNSIRHFIFYMRDKYDQKMRRLWSEEHFTLFEKYLHEHRACGLYLKLVLRDIEEEQPVFEEKGVFIPAEKTEEPIQPVNKLKLVAQHK